jgi:hypothetical protein
MASRWLHLHPKWMSTYGLIGATSDVGNLPWTDTSWHAVARSGGAREQLTQRIDLVEKTCPQIVVKMTHLEPAPHIQRPNGSKGDIG